MEFDDLIGPLLEREGGYVNHTADRGGETNYGITQRTLSAWLASRGAQWRSVRSLTRDDAVEIYFELYWKTANCPALPPAVRDIHFDSAVNHGVRQAVLLLQEAAGAAKEDGVLGKQTLQAVFASGADLLRQRYIAARYRFYGAIIQRDRTQLAFAAGWMRRMQDFQ